MRVHHGKHHQAYIAKVNELIAGSDLEGQTLERIVLASSGQPDRADLFNSAAQAWNHTFYWRSMKPDASDRPTAELAARIDASFGSFSGFKQQFADAAVKQSAAAGRGSSATVRRSRSSRRAMPTCH